MGGRKGTREERKRKEEERREKQKRGEKDGIHKNDILQGKGLVTFNLASPKLVPPRKDFSEIFGPTLKICSHCKWS